MAEVNLCPNPACAIDTTGWSFYSDYPATLSAVQVDGMTCSTAARVVHHSEDNPSDGIVYLYLPQVPATAGVSYSILLEVRVTGRSLTALPFASFSNPALIERKKAKVLFTAGVPRRILLTGTAPLTTTSLSSGVFFDGSIGGDTTIEVTAVRYGRGLQPTMRFADGDTPGWSWDGPAGLSTSLDSPSAAWVAAIEGGDRQPLVSARADWFGNGYDHPLARLDDVTETLSVERSIASSLPAEVGLVEGATAARASVSLSGRWPGTLNLDPNSPNVAARVSPSDALAPYRPDAPLFGAPVVGVPFTADTGVSSPDGRKLSRRFTGSVSALGLKASEQSAEVDLLDGANRLRAPMDLPAHAADSMLVRKFGQQGYSHRINSHFLIDTALRRNHIYASPRPHPDALVSATMHGSTIPEIGYGGLAQPAVASLPGASAWTRNAHPFGMMHPNPSVSRLRGTWTREIPTPTRGATGIGFSLWVLLPGAPLNQISPEMIAIKCDGAVTVAAWLTVNQRPALGIRGELHNAGIAVPSATWIPPTTPTWKFVGGHVSFGTSSARMYLWVDATEAVVSFPLPAGFRTSAARADTEIVFDTAVAFTNFSCWQAPSEPKIEWPGEDHISEARLDIGRNELLGIPAITGADSWSLIKEVTSAEFGTCGFDEHGTFEFRTRTVGADETTATVLSSDHNLSDLVVKIDEAAVRNVVTTSAAAYLIDDYEDIFESTAVDQMDCGPGVTVFEFAIDPNVLSVGGNKFFFTFTEQEWSDADKYQYRDAARVSIVQSARPQTGVDISSGNVTFAHSIIRPGVLRVTITNNTGVSLRFATKSAVDSGGVVTSDGQPAYKLGGRVVREQPEQTVTVWDEGSIVTYGERTYDLGGKSRFRQHLDSVSGIASAVLASTAQPAPVLDAITVPHDPRRKLRDRVRIVDKTGQGEIVGTVVGIKSTFDTKATDVLTVRPIGPPGLGILDDPTLGIVGSTLVFGA